MSKFLFISQTLSKSSNTVFKDPSLLSSSSSDYNNYIRFKSCESDDESKAAHSIVGNIIDDIFEKKTGITDVSSSSCCSSIRRKSSEYSFDKRLKYWQDMLKERKRIADHLKSKTGKHHGEMLFNYMTTVDERDKNTIHRIFDYAERMNVENLLKKQPLMLPKVCYCDNECWIQLNELQETLPQSEINGEHHVDIIGLPAIAKTEILGEAKLRCFERPLKWLQSEHLARHINENRSDIDRVVEFFPDVENLQVIGKNYEKKTKIVQPETDINFLGDKNVDMISSEESCYQIDCKTNNVRKPKEFKQEYALLINDVVYNEAEKSWSNFITRETIFKCQPYHKSIKIVLKLKNIGRKTIDFSFHKRPYYSGVPDLLTSTDNEFLFDKRIFRLPAGDKRNIIVKYQPRKIGIFKEQYMLKIDPVFFCNKCDSIFLKFIGVCRPCKEYMTKLRTMQERVIENSNLIMLKKLTAGLSELTPLIKPIEVFCPYKRELDEREFFEINNKGFKCERFHDLELLREIYNRLKKPRELAWDLKVSTLKEKVLSIENTEIRALTFAELTGILAQMRGVPISIEDKSTKNSERDRARLIYVRGVICTAIDDWEELVEAIEESFLKTSIRELLESYFDKKDDEEEGDKPNSKIVIGENDSVLQSGSLVTMSGEEITKILLKKLIHNKSFRDTLYIDTFTLLCNVVEDLVSVIESTENI